MHERIVEALRLGTYRSTAFEAARIHRAPGFEWLKLRRKQPEAHPHYAALLSDVEQARSEFIEEMHSRILVGARSKAPKTWQAAAWMLERTDPELHGKARHDNRRGRGQAGRDLAGMVSSSDEALETYEVSLRAIAGSGSGVAGGDGVANGHLLARELEP